MSDGTSEVSSLFIYIIPSSPSMLHEVVNDL